MPFALDAATHEALRRVARAHGATVFMTVQAGLAALLTRHGCGTDIPLGTPVAGRDDDTTAGLVGFFTNTVVLRTDTSGDPGFGALLDRVRTTTLAAYEHDALPFDHLVEALNPPRSLARHPLFQTMLAWQSIADGPAAFGPDATARLAAVPSGTAKFDLTLNAGELAAWRHRRVPGVPHGSLRPDDRAGARGPAGPAADRRGSGAGDPGRAAARAR